MISEAVTLFEAFAKGVSLALSAYLIWKKKSG